MKFNFTEKRQVILKPRRLKSNVFTIHLYVQGVIKFQFKQSLPSHNVTVKVINRIMRSNMIHTEYWSKV